MITSTTPIAHAPSILVVDPLSDIKAFGTRLIETQDLDPVYTALHGANLPHNQLCRLLLAYSCFYHLGAAAWLSEQGKNGDTDYWHWMRIAAQNVPSLPPPPFPDGRWPRSAERRHFRGQKCVAAIDALRLTPPQERIGSLLACWTEKQIIAEVSKWPLFGPWISFKIVDLVDRVLGHRLEWSEDVILMYKEPRAALDILNPIHPHVPYRALLAHWAHTPAPPRFERYCGPAEIETVLCKYKSSLGGHYHVGKDIREVRHGLQGWGETAERLLAACPAEVAV